MSVEIYSSGILISSGSIMENTTLSANEKNSMYVSSGGVANNTNVNSGGEMYVNNGTVNNTTVASNGIVVASSGAIVNDITVEIGGEFRIYDGEINTATVNPECFFCVYSGTVANDVVVSKGASLNGGSGAVFNNVEISGHMQTFSGVIVNSGNVYKNGSLYVNNGTEVNNIVVSSGGGIDIEDFAEVKKLTLKSGAVLDGFSFKNDKYFSCYQGGISEISSKVNIQGGYMFVYSGGNISGVTIEHGEMQVSSGGKAADIDGSGGLYVCSGGRVENASLAKGAVWNSGTMTNTTITDGELNIHGFMSDTVIHSGNMNVYEGTLAGTVYIGKDVEVYSKYGGKLIFSVNNRTTTDDYLVNDISKISDNFTYTITVSNVQASGIYKLAQGADNFTGSVSIGNGKSGDFGSLTVNGDICEYNDRQYQLIQSDGNLILNVSTCVYSNLVIDDYFACNAILNNASIISNGYLSLDSGGIANHTDINSAGIMAVWGGVANHTTINEKGIMYVYEGTVYDTVVNYGGIMTVAASADGNEGIKVTDTTVNSGGKMVVYYGEAENIIVKNGGKMQVGDDGIASGVEVAGSAIIESGGKLENSVINAGGVIFAVMLGSAENITVNTSGNLYVDLGAEVDNITLNGGNVHVGMGGCISNVEIDSGKLYLYGGAILDGVINVNGTMVLDDMTMNYGTVNLNLESASTASPMIENMKFLSGGNYTIDVDNTDTGSYIIGSNAGEFNSSFTITSNGDEIGSISVGETLNVGDSSYTIVKEDERIIVKSAVTLVPEIVSFSVNGIVFASSNDYVVEYSANNFSNVLQLEFTGTQIDTYNMTGGDIGFRTRLAKRDILTEAQKIQAPANSASPQKIVSNANDALDVFFADSDGIWSGFYAAEHNGSIGEWEGTKEMVTLDGKNRITDIFEGSADANILVLTDSANGDALFIDDIYSASPDAERTARFAQINEIRAGAGDDIIDMTSQRFEYSGNEITIRGGSGNDVIWAAGSDNDLFGDAGNDRIVGSAGFDIIIGGAGDDSMHSGGGDDIFAFCENWGVDTVEITDNANITLWFAAGNENNWDAENRIYSDGSNSVTVIGGKNSNIDLKFGDEGGQYSDMLDIGAFEPSSGERIFEDKALIA